MQRILLLLFLQLTGLILIAQQKKKLEFWVSSVDKASYLRITYHITEKEIKIKKGPYDFIIFAKNYKKDHTVFSKKLNDTNRVEFLTILKNIENDSLSKVYSNVCILDGLILHFQFKYGSKEMGTTVSNLYIEKMHPFTDFIDKLVPDIHQIGYSKEYLDKLKEGCPTWMILDDESKVHH